MVAAAFTAGSARPVSGSRPEGRSMRKHRTPLAFIACDGCLPLGLQRRAHADAQQRIDHHIAAGESRCSEGLQIQSRGAQVAQRLGRLTANRRSIAHQQHADIQDRGAPVGPAPVHRRRCCPCPATTAILPRPGPASTQALRSAARPARCISV